MKMRKWFKLGVSIIITLMIVTSTPVNAETESDVESTVEMILEDIKELDMQEDEVRQEIGNLTVNEMNTIREYLEEKPDITLLEQQVLEITNEVIYGDNKFRRVEQDTLMDKEERDANRRDAKEIVQGYTKDDKYRMREILYEKGIDNLEEEERILLDSIREDLNDDNKVVFITIAIIAFVVGIFLLIVDFTSSGNLALGGLGFIGAILMGVGLSIGMAVIIGDLDTITAIFN